MTPLRILIVDDEPPIRRFLRTALTAQDYRVEETGDGEAALEFLKRNPVDLIILDLGLPGMDGLEVVRRLRGDGSSTPIIILSSRDDEAGKVAALDLGADDYVAKPFGLDELMARIRAGLRHGVQVRGSAPRIQTGDLSIDLGRREVLRGGESVSLTPKEYDLLAELAVNLDRPVASKALLAAVWGDERADIQYLRVYIGQLRQKLGAERIVSTPGVGYRLGA